VNRATSALGIGAIKDDEYFVSNCNQIIKNREFLTEELKKLGFTFTNSSANFVFTKSDKINGKDLYLKLKEKGVLVRHFDKERISNYLRITIGSFEETVALINAVKEILGEIK
ncbi:MAG: aminotransferase class I/II-fold pyridoxal phosphate-dependent enzyme, partial [Clostridia bacterium]|nr:aminotransferase class I/II-fold pyridoxal phosphate-dependent enzyme [Clostridia bacterium]